MHVVIERKADNPQQRLLGITCSNVRPMHTYTVLSGLLCSQQSTRAGWSVLRLQSVTGNAYSQTGNAYDTVTRHDYAFGL